MQNTILLQTFSLLRMQCFNFWPNTWYKFPIAQTQNCYTKPKEISCIRICTMWYMPTTVYICAAKYTYAYALCSINCVHMRSENTYATKLPRAITHFYKQKPKGISYIRICTMWYMPTTVYIYSAKYTYAYALTMFYPLCVYAQQN
jgi:hypothetical protein